MSKHVVKKCQVDQHGPLKDTMLIDLAFYIFSPRLHYACGLHLTMASVTLLSTSSPF